MNINKKAFTLIELLAVIAILAIIMIIAVPTVLNIIVTAKKGSFKDSVLGIIKQAESNFNENLVLDTNYNLPLNNEYIVIDVADLKFDNKTKYTGYIILLNNNNTYEYYPYVSDNEYCIDGILKGNISTSNIKEAKNCTNTLIATDISIDTNKKITTTVSGTAYKYAGVVALTSNMTITSTKDFSYTGSEQTYAVPEDGYYKIELWGAQGAGTFASMGFDTGKGGYTSGIIFINKNTVLRLYVGGRGENRSNFNGSGPGQGYGGGATDIRLIGGSWSDFTSLKSRIMIAGGGGGFERILGGAGGNLIGGEITEYLHSATKNGGGGTQTSGGLKGITTSTHTFKNNGNGTFGIGGDAFANTDEGAGGGGGYYGGGAIVLAGAGGGGSSFISGYPGCNAVLESSTATNIIHTNQPIHYSKMYFKSPLMLSGIELMPNPKGGEMIGNIGNGYARITQLK